MHKILTIILLLVSISGIANQPQNNRDSIAIKILEEKIKNLDEKNEIRTMTFQEHREFNCKLFELECLVQTLKEKQDQTNNNIWLILGFVTIAVTFIGFLLRYFGQKYIDDTITNKLETYMKSRFEEKLGEMNQGGASNDGNPNNATPGGNERK